MACGGQPTSAIPFDDSSVDFEKLSSNQPANFSWLLTRPELLERVLSNHQINDEPFMIVNLFRFLADTIPLTDQRENLAILVIRLPSSGLLRLAYQHLSHNRSSSRNELALYLAQVLNFLLELHPTCWYEIDLIGLFDRLEWLTIKELKDEETQVENGKLNLKVEELRMEQEKAVTKEKQPIVQFERDDPPPNDFHQLSIYPSLEEIFEQQMPYLRRNITEGAYRDGIHYLDIHFRLLREDFLCPLREAICQYVTKPPGVKFQNSNVRLYTNVVFAGCVCSQVGILYALRLDFSTLPSSIHWAQTRRLIFGNLLAATYDDFNTSCFLLSVEDRSGIEQRGIVYVKSQQELAGTKLATLSLGTRLSVLETTAYFEASRPILMALQNITDDRIPLERYLLTCDLNVDMPAYLKQINGQIDLRPVSKGFIDMSDTEDLTTWPSAQQMELDQSQYDAVKLALTKAVALIQGPPGCGKTYIGVRLAEIFYHNRKYLPENCYPILMICYTNHALDQFLSAIIRKLSLSPKTIVRVGGRSKHPEIEPFLIQKLRQKRGHPVSEELTEMYAKLDTINKEIKEFSNQWLACSKKLLTYEQLLTVIDKRHFFSLIEPILHQLHIYKSHWCLNTGVFCCRGADENWDDDDRFDALLKETREKIRLKNRASNNDDEEETEIFLNTLKPDQCMTNEDRMKRKENRVDCRQLNSLDDKDVKCIYDLFVDWLNASQMEIFSDTSMTERKDENTDDDEPWHRIQHKWRRKAQHILNEKNYSNTDAAVETLPSTDNADQSDLFEDEEERSRRENQDLNFSSAENDQQNGLTNTQTLEFMQNLLNSLDGTKGFRWKAEVDNIQNLWSLNPPQRRTLYRFWLRTYAQKLTEMMHALVEEYGKTQHLIQELWLENDACLMENAFIIAMTTHCAARYQKVLKKIKPRICIVEEAAEVFESHIVTAVGEHLEHLILIGDHEQLRPSPNVYTLARNFNLDVSLFERLIKNKMPSVQLSVQHRSIPIISSFLIHFYDIPIENHSSVQARLPTIKGVTHPLFFIDHRNLEESVIEGSSKRNPFEADYVLNLANYLVQNGARTTQITILTTYMGQRQMIHYKLIDQFKQLKGVTVTTVDNYQGEENHIVLLSLVRSNTDQKLGYLAVKNRICVSMSRAQNGFFVIGNFQLLAEQNETWRGIIKQMHQAKLIGPGLPVFCPKHADDKLICSDAYDFLKRPLGGCGLICDTRLPCGHACPLTCHDNITHDTLVCKKLCMKAYEDCDHQCAHACHLAQPDCPPCTHMVKVQIPDCQHICDISCSKVKANILECSTLVPYTCLAGHQVHVKCCDLKKNDMHNQLCNQRCEAILECGHICLGNCTSCLGGRFHVACSEQELIVFHCGHAVKQQCHLLGPKCEEIFMKMCHHDHRPSISNSLEECKIYECPRYCFSRCRHMEKCQHRCTETCPRRSCKNKCSIRFQQCEHYCNGVCGEPCIPCLHCQDQCQLPTEIQNAVRQGQTRHLILIELECGHLLRPALLDQHVEQFLQRNSRLANGFTSIIYPGCPECGWPLVRCKRYANIINRIHNRIRSSFKNSSLLNTIKTGSSKFNSTIGILDINENSLLPSWIPQPVREHIKNARSTRLHALAELFVHALSLFQELSMTSEVNQVLKSLYSYIETTQSFFLTRQQWTDLENEFNRLRCIQFSKRFHVKADDSDKNVTLTDILQGSKKMNKETYEKCMALFNIPQLKTYSWQSLFLENTTLDDYEVDRLQCDGNWFRCPKDRHLIWNKTLAEKEDAICEQCEKIHERFNNPRYAVTQRRSYRNDRSEEP